MLTEATGMVVCMDCRSLSFLQRLRLAIYVLLGRIVELRDSSALGKA